MSTARKVLSNTLVQVAGKVGVSIVAIVTVKIITNYLGTNGYGQYSQVYEFLALFGILSDLGLFTIAVREMAKDEEKVPEIIGNILSIRTVSAFLAMILAVIMVFVLPQIDYFHNPYKDSYVPLGVVIASIGVFLSIIAGTMSSILQLRLKMEQATIALVAGRLVSLTYIVFAVYKYKNDQQAGFIHLMWAGVFGSILMTFLTWYYSRKLTSLKPRFDFVFWKNVVFRSLPYGIALILNTVYLRINSVLIFNLRGAEEAGIFAVPLKITDILSVVSIYFMNSILPILTRKIKEIDKEGGKEKVNQIIQYSFDFLTAVGLPMMAGLFILAYPTIFVISSEKFLSRINEGFYGSDIALQILVFALFFSYLNNLMGVILVALNKQNMLLWTSGACVLFNVIFNLIMIPKYGFRGGAMASVFSELFILIALYWLTHRYFDYKLNFKSTLKALFSTIIMGTVLYLTREPLYALIHAKAILVLIPLGGMVYGIMMLLTKGITKEMLKMLKKS